LPNHVALLLSADPPEKLRSELHDRLRAVVQPEKINNAAVTI
jgi:hypothetical protein